MLKEMSTCTLSIRTYLVFIILLLPGHIRQLQSCIFDKYGTQTPDLMLHAMLHTQPALFAAPGILTWVTRVGGNAADQYQLPNKGFVTIFSTATTTSIVDCPTSSLVAGWLTG